MPASQYGKYIIISRARFDDNAGFWLPYDSVVADGERNFYYRQFMDVNTRFETEEQALSSRLHRCSDWIDEHL